MNMNLTETQEPTQVSLRSADRESESARAMIESRLTIAQKFPRDVETAFGDLMRSCDRKAFADKVEYSFKRGRKLDETSGQWVDNYVTGPTVDLAREAARCWGHIDYGFEIVNDDREWRHIKAYAHDLQTNTRVTCDDSFRKLVQRKNKEVKNTEWVTPNERDLRELTNRYAALAVRNCILQLLPKDLIDDARGKAKATLRNDVTENIETHRKKIIMAFGELGISAKSLQEYLGHPLSEATADEIVELRAVWKSIHDGNSNWAEYVSDAAGDDESDGDTLSDAASKESSKQKPRRKTVKDVVPDEPKRKRSRSKRKSYDEFVVQVRAAEDVETLLAIKRQAMVHLTPDALDALTDVIVDRQHEIEGTDDDDDHDDQNDPETSVEKAEENMDRLFPEEATDEPPTWVDGFEQQIGDARTVDEILHLRDSLREMIDDGAEVDENDVRRVENLLNFRQNQFETSNES